MPCDLYVDIAAVFAHFSSHVCDKQDKLFMFILFMLFLLLCLSCLAMLASVWVCDRVSLGPAEGPSASKLLKGAHL